MPKKLVQTYLTQRDAGKKALSPKIKLTQAIVGWLPIKSYDYSIGDSTVPSLFVRVRQNTGSKTFYIVRKITEKLYAVKYALTENAHFR